MNEYVLVRMGIFGRLLFVGLALVPLSFALFCLTFTVDLRCERVAERALFCSSHVHSLFHDTDETMDARDVQEVSIANNALLLPETRRTIAAELEAFVQRDDDTSYAKRITGDPFLLAMLASLTLFFPVALWRAVRDTVVAVDRQAGTVIISRRLLGFAVSRTVVPLSRTVTVMGRQRRKGQDLYLQVTRGEPVHIEWVPQRRAVTDFAALKRLFPVGGNVLAR